MYSETFNGLLKVSEVFLRVYEVIMLREKIEMGPQGGKKI